MRQQNHRSGVILILAMGLSVMLAALALAFVAKTRLDASEMSSLVRTAQSRLMLSAACAYVLESGRIGWDLSDEFDSARQPWATLYAAVLAYNTAYPSAPAIGEVGQISADATNALQHEECFGWVDVRDGSVGPRTLDYDGLVDGDFDALQPPAYDPGGGPAADTDDDETSRYDRRYSTTLRLPRKRGGALVRPYWPAIGGVCRAPMAVMTRPPFALRPETTPNPINQDPAAWDFGLPLLRNADGNPSLSPDLPVTATQADRWQDWKTGDRSGRLGGAQGAWFRLYRDTPATFIVTVGCGGTFGFRDWDEVEAENADARYGYDRALFQQLLDEEERLWFRIEWSPAIAATQPQYSGSSRSNSGRSGPIKTVNQTGTISLIQRLRMQPREW